MQDVPSCSQIAQAVQCPTAFIAGLAAAEALQREVLAAIGSVTVFSAVNGAGLFLGELSGALAAAEHAHAPLNCSHGSARSFRRRFSRGKHTGRALTQIFDSGRLDSLPPSEQDEIARRVFTESNELISASVNVVTDCSKAESLVSFYGGTAYSIATGQGQKFPEKTVRRLLQKCRTFSARQQDLAAVGQEPALDQKVQRAKVLFDDFVKTAAPGFECTPYPVIDVYTLPRDDTQLQHVAYMSQDFGHALVGTGGRWVDISNEGLVQNRNATDDRSAPVRIVRDAVVYESHQGQADRDRSTDFLREPPVLHKRIHSGSAAGRLALQQGLRAIRKGSNGLCS